MPTLLARIGTNSTIGGVRLTNLREGGLTKMHEKLRRLAMDDRIGHQSRLAGVVWMFAGRD